MARHMPKLEAYFHYRNLDVSTLKELCKRWKPEVAKGVKKGGKHEALADIHESIEEMRYYRENFLKHTLAYHGGFGPPRIEPGKVTITKSKPATRAYGAAGEAAEREERQLAAADPEVARG